MNDILQAKWLPLKHKDVIRLKSGEFAVLISSDMTYMCIRGEDDVMRMLPIREFDGLVIPASEDKLEDTQEIEAAREERK